MAVRIGRFAGIMMRDFPGARNIMWSSDYPHSETTYLHSHELIAELFEGAAGRGKAMIQDSRCKALFNL